MITAEKSIGIGIYSPAEAAFYARVRTQNVNRWLFGDAKGEPVVIPQFDSQADDKIVTFRDFVQVMAVRAIRTMYPKISLQKIRKAVDLCKEQLGIEHPFAVDHRTFVFDNREIVLEVRDKLIQISGKHSRNLLLGPIAELYMTRIEFGEDGFAAKYRAWGGDDCPIVIDPRRRFGEPVVTSCGITAQTLWEASIVEGGLEAAAAAYGIRKEEVAAACDYYDHLTTAA